MSIVHKTTNIRAINMVTDRMSTKDCKKLVIKTNKWGDK